MAPPVGFPKFDSFRQCVCYENALGLRDLRFIKPAYTQKKSARETSLNLQILKKNKKNNFRLYVGLTGKDEFVFDVSGVFQYMQV